MALVRSLPVFFRQQQAREYVRRPTRDLHGKTVGIVGLGGVGRRVAEVLSGFKTRIVATDWFPYQKPPHTSSSLIERRARLVGSQSRGGRAVTATSPMRPAVAMSAHRLRVFSAIGFSALPAPAAAR